VWGDWHVQTFLEINLPTLLAPRNLPVFAKLLPSDYLIYTTYRDRERIKRAPLFREFARLVDVTFIELSEVDIKAPTFTHNWVWDKGRLKALATGSMAMVMPPDVAWSNGSLGHLAELVAQGKSAIFLNWHLRAVSETFIPQFFDLYHQQNRPIAVSGRELVRLTMENIHPLCCAYLRDSPAFPYHSEMIFWPIAGQGLLMHVFALIPFLFDPAEFQLTENKSIVDIGDPSRLHCVEDSDDVFMTSLAPIGKDNVWYQRNGGIDPIRFGKWWTYYDSPSNDHLAVVPFRLHYAEIDNSVWRRTELGARHLIRRLVSNRELYRLYIAARRLGCAHAAQLLAAAMHLGLGPLLVRRLGPVTAFIPRDEAFGHRWEEIADTLLHPDNTQSFLEFLRAHFVSSANLGAGSTVGSEEDGAAALPEVFELGEPFRTGAHTVHTVEKLLCAAPLVRELA